MFCQHFHLQDINPTPRTLCLYVEFLARTFCSPKAIRNYISGVRLLHKYLGAQATSFNCFEMNLMLRAIDNTLSHTPNQRLPITIDILQALCSKCDRIGGVGLVLKFAFLLGFFAFLRQSNLAPRSARSFDKRKHTCREDIIMHPPGLVLLLKWTKTRQHLDAQQMIPLPAIPGHPLCPVRAFQNMISAVPTPADSNGPLLLHPFWGEILTVGYLRRAFTLLIQTLGLQRSDYSFYSLCRGGVTAAYQAGVDYIHIKRHGTWKSDTCWEYISTAGLSSRSVATKLARSILRSASP